jgi:hypothetical protein
MKAGRRVWTQKEQTILIIRRVSMRSRLFHLVDGGIAGAIIRALLTRASCSSVWIEM